MAATDYDFLLTRNELIEQAWRKIGVLPQGETMSAEQLSDAVARLNMIVNEWTVDGVFVWRRFPVEMTLGVNTSEYEFPDDAAEPVIETIDSAFVRINNIDTELEYLNFREFQQISNKEATGVPVVFSLDHKESIIHFWPTPTVADTVLLWCVARLRDWGDEDESGDFPARWQRSLFYALVCDLLEDNPSTSLSRREMEAKADKLYMRARRGESDNSDNEFVKGSYD